jgi:hypothetical protein
LVNGRLIKITATMMAAAEFTPFGAAQRSDDNAQVVAQPSSL